MTAQQFPFAFRDARNHDLHPTEPPQTAIRGVSVRARSLVIPPESLAPRMQSETNPSTHTDHVVRECRGCHRETHRARTVRVQLGSREQTVVVCPECEPDLRGTVLEEVSE